MKTKDRAAIRARKYERRYGRYIPAGATCYVCHRSAPDQTGEVKRLADGRHICWRHKVMFREQVDHKLTERQAVVA
jgi:hypothetical protein